ncbi:hypothetical protein DL98DRAFT_234414 [Cadophora sp. DSE1049]|nr:hypothetical protein DL98DRAFT_234414 [Cadophora sp. DSE1049]
MYRRIYRVLVFEVVICSRFQNRHSQIVELCQHPDELPILPAVLHTTLFMVKDPPNHATCKQRIAPK